MAYTYIETPVYTRRVNELVGRIGNAGELARATAGLALCELFGILPACCMDNSCANSTGDLDAGPR